MEIDDEEIEVTTSTSSKGEKKRFEVKKVRKFNKEISPLYFRFLFSQISTNNHFLFFFLIYSGTL